jgi:hypothetical protein
MTLAEKMRTKIIAFAQISLFQKQVIAGSKMDLFPGHSNATDSSKVSVVGDVDGMTALLLPACATLLLAALALLLAMSERWPRAVASAMLAVFLILAAFILTYGLQDEPPVTFA